MIVGDVCAECGKQIEMTDASYYRVAGAGEDFGKAYHTRCGDPFGIKAKDAEIVRLNQRVIEMQR